MVSRVQGSMGFKVQPKPERCCPSRVPGLFGLTTTGVPKDLALQHERIMT